MASIQLAHLSIQGISVAVFAANGRHNTDASRAQALAELTARARNQGLRVDKSALAYRTGSRTQFYGTPDLVRYLAGSGVPRWTHRLKL